MLNKTLLSNNVTGDVAKTKSIAEKLQEIAW